MSTTVEKKEVNQIPCTIRPYLAPSVENMGLENYGMVIFEGAKQVEYITCISENGVDEYITGLNEFAKSVRSIRDDKERTAKIKSIREKVVFLERVLGSNNIDIEDPQFWDKVKTVHPNNHAFWKDFNLSLTNSAIYLDPENPMDLIKICAIEAGGFGEVAKSYADARARRQAPKFYLERREETVVTHTEIKKMRNKALARLEHITNKETNKLFYLLKVLDQTDHTFKKSSSPDIMYDGLDKFINAEGAETSRKRAAQEFLDADALPLDKLMVKAMVFDATFYKLIHTKPSDQMIYHAKSGAQLGRNVEDAIETLMSPLHEKTYLELQKELEKYWN